MATCPACGTDEAVQPFRKLFNRMLGTFAEHQWAALLRSYVLAMKPERKARLSTIVALSVELERIKAESIYATSLHEQVIEAIIQGDWKEVAEVNAMLAEPHGIDEEYNARYRRLWEGFRAVTLAACADAARREAGQDVEPD